MGMKEFTGRGGSLEIIQAVILGVIQGLTEFLPVSSSGHLMLVQRIFGVAEPSLTMTILLHLGTLVAVFVVFWRDWWAMLKNPFKNHVFWMLVLATLPTIPVALLLKDVVDGPLSGLLLGICFLVTGLLLTLAEWFSSRRRPVGRHSRRSQLVSVESVTPKQALSMGAMQAVAILPGVSRSGSTIVGGLFAGLPRTTAAKFSFMMSAPAILGSLILELKDIVTGEARIFTEGWLAPMIGVVVSGIVGYLAIRWMLKLLNRVSLRVFAVYVGILGVLVLLDTTVFHLFF